MTAATHETLHPRTGIPLSGIPATAEPKKRSVVTSGAPAAAACTLIGRRGDEGRKHQELSEFDDGQL